MQCAEPSLKDLHGNRHCASKPNVVLDANVEQVLVLRIVDLIEGKLIFLPLLFRLTQVFEAISVKVERFVDVFLRLARMIL
jgi:hypothetical protein